MDGMGMDSGSNPMFKPYNQTLATGYWYIVAFVVGFLLVVRAADFYQMWSRSALFFTSSPLGMLNNMQDKAFSNAEVDTVSYQSK